MNFSEFADIVTVVSGTMTIFGVGGVISWGFFARQRSALASAIVDIFAYSIKTSFVAVLLVPAYWGWWIIYYFTFVSVTGGSFSFVNPYWDSSEALPHIVAYITSTGFIIPLYGVLAACIYNSSLRPAGQLIKAIFGRSSPASGDAQLSSKGQPSP